jgi:uncharacterized surface protein with fasciclin (FAS1) repeats
MERIKMKRLSFVVTMLALLVASVVPVTAAPAAQEAQNIVEIAVNDGRFETLVTALTATGLDETLRGDGPFTVFAPTDDAFNALPDGTIEALLDDTETLSNILLYHVVSGKVMAADVVNLDSAETVLGESVDINVSGETVMVNDAQVIITDIEASNGVIHVIDSVLLPPAEEAGAGGAAGSEMEGEAPSTMPVAGGESSANLFLILLLVGGILAVSGLALRWRPTEIKIDR